MHEVDDLHLTVEAGDSVGVLFRTGEVDVGARARRRPDGAIQSFTLPAGLLRMDGGTGVELLYDAVVEPDVDEDGLGDETQDQTVAGWASTGGTTGSRTSRRATSSTTTSKRTTPRRPGGGSES